MPEIKNPTEYKPPEASEAPKSTTPKSATTDSATAVWLKLLGLLVGLSAFGLLIFWLSRGIRTGF